MSSAATRRLDFALVLLRLAVGLVFVMHGWQKITVFGHAGLTGFFEAQGIPFASVNAVIVPLVEVGGGLALIAGLLTRWVSPLLAFVMLVALVSVHWPSGFFLPDGYEFVLTLLAASAALGLTGPGAFSVDARLGRRGSSSYSETVRPRAA